MKPLGRIRLWIAEWGRAGDHLGEQAAAHGTEREPPMGVSIIEPEARLAGRAADHGPRIRKAGPRAHPGLRLDAFSQRIEFAGSRQETFELHGCRLCVASREFSA